MLPAKGYLKSINCPFFETCICERPYCHYKHNKKDTTASTDLISDIVTKAVQQVLQENHNHIHNGNGNNGKNANNVTYNPTPIAQLNKYNNNTTTNNTNNNNINNIEINKKHIPIQYTPEQPRSFRKIQRTHEAAHYVPSLINNDQQQKVVPNFSDDILNDPNIYDVSDSDSETTLEQCKRIFDEYKCPPSTTTTPSNTNNDQNQKSNVIKKRIAYENPQNTKKEPIIKPVIKNPGLVMADRYNLKRCPENTECPIKPKRIASVPNVAALLEAKKSIDQMIKRNQQEVTTTILKAKERTAHVPDLTLTDLPTVRLAEKSRLPVNIRTRYFFLIVRECLKIYVSRQAAYERALNEEFKCYSKCNACNSYKNTIMLLINRLRKEFNGQPINSVIIKENNLFDDCKLYDYVRKWILTDDELYENGFPRLGARAKGHALFIKNNKMAEKVPVNCEQCARCKKMFQVNEKGFPAVQEDCVYHPYNRVLIKGEAKYSCCQQMSLRQGCCISNTHVFEITNPEKLTGFVSTFEPEGQDPRSKKIYALDCEMVYTTRGLELARVTVIDNKCNVCYETLVKPLGDILDCNTRFSGLTHGALENVQTKITDVQATLLLMFNSETILVGHSFESDLKALRLIHNCVIDTSVLFPHKMGPQKKRALRTLASDFLKKIIQNDEAGGHDSAEDAITCMELLMWKLKEELKTK